MPVQAVGVHTQRQAGGDEGNLRQGDNSACFFIILYVVANAFMSGLGKYKNSISIHLTSYFPASYPGVLVPRPGVPRHQGQAAQELRTRQVHLAQVGHLASAPVSLVVQLAVHLAK